RSAGAGRCSAPRRSPGGFRRRSGPARSFRAGRAGRSSSSWAPWNGLPPTIRAARTADCPLLAIAAPDKPAAALCYNLPMTTQHALTAPDAADRLRLPDDVQRQLLQVAHRQQLQRGDSLFLKGSAPDALFGVVSGSLRVSVVAAGGREAVIAVL